MNDSEALVVHATKTRIHCKLYVFHASAQIFTFPRPTGEVIDIDKPENEPVKIGSIITLGSEYTNRSARPHIFM